MSVAGHSWAVVHVVCDGQSLFVSDDWGGRSMSVAGRSWAVVHVLCDGRSLFVSGSGGHAVVVVHGWSSPFRVEEGSRCSWVVGVSGQLPSFVPILCCCLWARGMGAPRFSCVVVPVFCCGGQSSSFVGGWSGRSSSLVGVVVLCVLVVVCGRPEFCCDDGWFVSFVGGRAHFVW